MVDYIPKHPYNITPMIVADELVYTFVSKYDMDMFISQLNQIPNTKRMHYGGRMLHYITVSDIKRKGR